MIAIGTAAPSDDVPSERDLVGPDETTPLDPDSPVLAALARSRERVARLSIRDGS